MTSQKNNTNPTNKNNIQDSNAKAGRDILIGDTHYHYPNNSTLLLLLVIGLVFTGIYFLNTNTQFENKETSEQPVQEGTEVEKVVTKSATDIKKPKGNSKDEIVSSKIINTTPLTKVNNKPIEKSKPVSDFLDINQNVEIALFNSNRGEFSLFREKIKSRLKSNQIKFSNSYFRPEFIQQFGNSVLDFDLAKLKDIGIDKRLNCICQIIEAIRIEENEEDGMTIYTAYSEIVIHILNLRTRQIETIPFDDKIAGMTKSGAKENLKEHLLKSKNLELINTKPCK